MAALPLISTGISRTLYPYNCASAYEGHSLAPAELIISGQNPYSSTRPVEPPYVVAVYGPLYYAVLGVGMALFGSQLWFGRVVMLACAFLAILLVSSITRHLGREDEGSPAIAAAFFAAQFPLQAWIGVQRPDVLALALSLASLWMVLKLREQEDLVVWRLGAAVVLAAAAVLVRQTAMMAIPLGTLALAQRRRWKEALAFSLGSVAAPAATVGFLDAMSGGGALEQLLAAPARLPSELAVLSRHLRSLALAPATWITMGAVGLGVHRALRRSARTWSAPGLTAGNVETLLHWLTGNPAWAVAYVCSAVLVALVTSSIPGSNVNYYLEAMAALSITAALCLRPARSVEPATAARRELAILAAIAIAALFTGARLTRGEYLRWASLPYYDEIVRKIGEMTPPGSPSFSVYPELVWSAERPYYFNAFVPYDGRDEAWAAVFRAVLSSGRLAAIVWHEPEVIRGYEHCPTSAPVPRGYYAVHLHVRSDLGTCGRRDVVGSGRE